MLRKWSESKAVLFRKFLIRLPCSKGKRDEDIRIRIFDKGIDFSYGVKDKDFEQDRVSGINE